jgi:arylsulfatase
MRGWVGARGNVKPVTPDQPNILFLVSDQQRWDAFGATGGWVDSPHIDRLAAEGMLFTTCVANAPACIPARRALASGLYPHTTGVWESEDCELPLEAPFWVRAIRDTGYATALFGKLHLYPYRGDLRERADTLAAYGFDVADEVPGPNSAATTLSHLTARWEQLGLWEAYRADLAERKASWPPLIRPTPLPLDQYPDVYIGTRAAEHLARTGLRSPWFCWVGFVGPHEPWDAPLSYAGRYEDRPMPAPARRIRSLGERPRGELDDRLDQWAPGGLAASTVRRLRANYAAKVTVIDEQVGRILAVLEQRGELDRTVVIFTSDHGEMNGDHGLLYKQTFLDGSVRVPLIVRPPRGAEWAPAGSVCHDPVEWFDVGPTLAELAGVRPLAGQQAASLTPSLRDPGRGPRASALCELRGELMLLTRGGKIAVNQRGETYLLVDRVADPGEGMNLASDPAAGGLEAHLRSQLLERVVQSFSAAWMRGGLQ